MAIFNIIWTLAQRHFRHIFSTRKAGLVFIPDSFVHPGIEVSNLSFRAESPESRTLESHFASLDISLMTLVVHSGN